MDGRRAGYLRALGIDVWVPRHAISQAAEAAVSVEAAPAAKTAPPEPAAPPRGQVTESRPEARSEPRSEYRAETLPEPTAPAAVEAAGATDAEWERIRAEVLACTKCPLHARRTQGVFGVGNRQAKWLVIGEAPGEEEDLRGEPFVGRAGQLLDAMLAAIGLSRQSNVYIANVLKSRPPGNRDPAPAEVAACMPYLTRQIALLQPKLMLAVGRIAAQNLLRTTVPLGRLRGKVHHFGELNTPLIVTYHPAYLLRSPGEKRKAWEDLKFAREHFRQLTQGSIDGHRS